MAAISNPIFQDEDKAREYLEKTRWPNGAVCPFCSNSETVKTLGGASMGAGWYHCTDCRKKFTVRVGTLYERSHIPLHKWLYATHLLCASKKGMSAHQLSRLLGITYKSAWFMAHRIREAMKPVSDEPIGGEGKIVEADETELALSRKSRRRPRSANPKVMSLVERGGRTRSFHLDSNREVKAVVREHVDEASKLHTDSAPYYKGLLEKHEAVDHSKREYVRGDVHTNTLEGFFSVFKRGMVGTYQHCGEQHLHRYLAEFDFRQNTRAKLGINDTMRAQIALKGIEGKRLTYRRIDDRA